MKVWLLSARFCKQLVAVTCWLCECSPECVIADEGQKLWGRVARIAG